MNQETGHPELDLKLNLFSVATNQDGSLPLDSASSTEEIDRDRSSLSCVSSEPGGGEAKSMVVVGCPNCLMYIMLVEGNPRCPRCKSKVLLDFLKQNNGKNIKKRNKKS